MLVRFCMTPHPVTVTPHDTLVTAQEKMTAGRCRRLPSSLVSLSPNEPGRF